uniref:Uncharacterized protein n=1 Tax=Chrysotila carterae TaxID=13221 RepID=A0A7S4EXT9_CHRCT
MLASDADLACHVFEDPRWVCYPPKYDPNYVAPTQDHEPWYCPPDQALCSQLVPPPAPPSPSPHSPPPLPFPPPPPPPSPPEPSPPPPHPIASPPPAPSPPPPIMPPDTPIVHLTPRKPSLPSVQAEEKAFTPSGAANAANGSDAAITIEHDVVVVTSAASPSPPKWPAPDPPSAQAPARTIEIASAPPPVFPASLPPPSNPTVVYGGEALHIAGSTWHVSRLQQYFPYFVAAVVTPVASLTVVFGGFMYFVCRRRQKRSSSQRSVGGPEGSFRSSAHNKGFVDEQKRAPRGADGLSAVTNAIFIERLQEAVLLPAESQHVDDDDESCVLLCDDTTNGTLPYDSTHGGTHDDAQYDDAQYDDAQRHGAPTGNTGSCTCNGVPHAQPLLQAREDRRAWDGGGHSHASVETSAVRDLDAEASAIFAMVQGDEI